MKLHWMKSARHTLVAIASSAAMGVFAQGAMVDLSSSRGVGVNQQDVLMENVRVLVPVPNPMQPGTSTTVESNYNVLFRLDPATLHLVPQGIQQTAGDGVVNCAQAQVTVFDSLRGSAQPLPNASVTIGTRTATTNAQGVATFTGLPQGFFGVSAAAAEYVTSSQIALLQCTTPNQLAVALSPTTGVSGGLVAGQFRVVLTWGENPRDIDSHLTGPSATSDDRWHVYFGNKQAGDMCALDVDDTSSFGPETVTCPPTIDDTGKVLRPGVYRYSVHHYSGTQDIGTSGANVRLELGNGQSYSFTPPTASYAGSGDVWTVFELTVFPNGTVGVAPVHSVMSGVSAGSVARSAPSARGTGLGQMENPSLFHRLGTK
jgi:hypothetical protein